MKSSVLCSLALLPALAFASSHAQVTAPVGNASASSPTGKDGSTDSNGAEAEGQIKTDPKAAVDEVAALFTPNPDVTVSGARMALPANGSWGVKALASSDSDPAAQACDGKIGSCVRVLYRVQSPAVECSWVVHFLRGSVKHADGTSFDGVYAEVVDEDENAARYTLRKSWQEGGGLPVATRKEDAQTPAIAQAAHVEGTVGVRIVVGHDGKVMGTRLISGPPVLATAAMNAAKSWQFVPEMVGKRPIVFQASLSFEFNALNGGYIPGLTVKGTLVIRTARVGPHI